jgi:hypothetical protein
MSVEKWRKTGNLQSRKQFISESGRVLPRIGDEDLKFFPCAGHKLKRREWPRRRRAADQRDELAPLHSITSSARASKVGGTSSPSALAVLRLMTSSNLVGASTGKSAGFAPRSMRST